MKMCRCACDHTLRDHVRNDEIRESLKVESRGAGKRDWGGLATSRGDTKTTSEERLWRWYHPGEESEEDRSRDGWDGLGQPRHGNRNDGRRGPWQNWLEENCVWRSDPTTNWERLEEEALVWPALAYGAGGWTLHKVDDHEINAAVLWFHRSMLRICWIDKRANASILNGLNTRTCHDTQEMRHNENYHTRNWTRKEKEEDSESTTWTSWAKGLIYTEKTGHVKTETIGEAS